MAATRTASSAREYGPDNVFMIKTQEGDLLCTRSDFRGEDDIEFEGNIFKPWSPATSKLASVITKGMNVPVNKNSRILYLGAASGTTVSHVSDIAANGIVYAVEFAPRPARDLLMKVGERTNVIPILADARHPEKYPPFIDSVDFIFQDVAQPDQADIAIANAEKYLNKGGHLIIAIKGRSISVSEDLETIFDREVSTLEKRFEIMERISLEPLHHDHIAVLCKY